MDAETSDNEMSEEALKDYVILLLKTKAPNTETM